jgi:hypothetical protein
MNFPNSAGEPESAVPPRSASRVLESLIPEFDEPGSHRRIGQYLDGLPARGSGKWVVSAVRGLSHPLIF